MPDEERAGKSGPDQEKGGSDKAMHIIDMPYVQYLTVWDEEGNAVTIDNSADGVVVPAAQVQAVYDTAIDAGILVEEVTT